MYLIMAAVMTSYAVMSDEISPDERTWAFPGDTYLVTFPSMTFNTSEAFFVLSTASIDNLLLVMVTYKDRKRLALTDFTMNRFTPEVIKKHGNQGAESGMCYLFMGTGYFRLVVVMAESSVSIASFMAVPLGMWSKSYLLLVIKRSSVLQIISSQENVISVRLNFNLEGQTFQWNNQVYSTGEAIRYIFEAYQVLSLLFCDHESFSSLISASVDASNPIGVILSNCRNEVIDGICPNVHSTNFISVRSIDDMTAEMLLGEEHLGKEYVTLHHSRWGTNVRYYVMAYHDRTAVNVTLDDNIDTAMINKKEWFIIEPDHKVAHIVSDQNVQVVFTLYSRDCSIGIKEQVICQLVPTQMFFTRYHWLNWNTTSYFTFDVLVVIKLSDIASLYMDGKRLSVDSFKWSPVSGNSTWRVGQLSRRGTAHYLFQQNSQPFGCYLHAKGIFSAAMNFAGLITHECQPTRNLESPLTTVDDDCDEVIDEEVENGIDDDFDLLIDEDTNGMIPDIKNVAPREVHANYTRGQFGSNGKFKCHCADGNCDDDGYCATSTQCATGWFGTKCQYSDMAKAANLADRILYDNDDTTCMKLVEPKVIVKLLMPYTYSWIRLVFGNNDIEDYFYLNFLKDTREKTHELLPCTNVKVYRLSERIIDLYCLDEELPLVLGIVVTWQGGDFLCSISASGGRNIALRQPALRVRDLPVRAESSADAKDIVDGSQNKSQQGLLGLNTFRYIDVTLSPMKYVQSIKLYSDISTYGSKITVQLMDEYDSVRFTVDVTLVKPVHHVINTDAHVLVGIVRLKLTHGGFYLNEVEIFGDCAPPFFGLDCTSFCGLSCVHEKCNPQGVCFRCHPKKSGPFCDYASNRDPRIDEFLDNSSQHNEEEGIMGQAPNTPMLLIVACMFPVLGFAPCIIIMMRVEKTGMVDQEEGQSFVDVRHWPSPELDSPKVATVTQSLASTD